MLEAPRVPKLPAGNEVTIGSVRTASFSTEDLTSDPAGEFARVESLDHEVTDMVPV
ncbi:MAG TPA: hypothetical protein VH089_09860 [Streptosporangiaceae bacterium]|nr:hypothetical protein [Streptosporangiaceae bacterium]